MSDPLHWLFALIATLVMGLPVIYLVTRMGVAAGIQAFYRRLDDIRNEVHEMKGDLDAKITRTWDYVTTVHGKLNRVEDRVSQLEGDTGEE